ncbi:MAG: hypothetical protein KJ626_01145, partial [Verrucomicrobia bacterium]|nr:hypothetical protein [Verrucomicrobiota bacterium]
EFVVRWSSPGGIFFRSLKEDVTETNRWFTLSFPVGNQQGQEWFGGTDAALRKALTNVVSVQIRITPTGLSPQAYLIDDFFLHGLPAAQELGVGQASTSRWTNLRTNFSYELQFAGPDFDWVAVTSFVAGASSQELVHENAWSYRSGMYRLSWKRGQ